MTYRTRAELATYIGELREEHGLSQRELGEKLGVDRTAMSRIESGTRGLAVDELAIVAELFGKTADEILRKDEMAFAFRAEGDDADTDNAVALFNKIYDDFFALKTAAS